MDLWATLLRLDLDLALKDLQTYLNVAQLRIWALTIEINAPDVSQELLSIDIAHAGAEAGVSEAVIPVHAVQRVCHRINRIHHKLHLPFLLITGVTADLLQTCANTHKTHIFIFISEMF